MKKFTALLVVAAASMYFTGCGENGTNVTNGFADQKGSSSSTEKKGNADEEETGDYDKTVETADDLGKCTAKKDGKVYFVEEDEVAYTCKYDEDTEEGEWVKKEKKPSKPVADETVDSDEDLPKCSSKTDGDIYYIEEDEVYVKCDAEEGDWVPVKTEDKDKPSSSNSSSLPDKPSSSDSSTQTSSGSTPTPTSAESYAPPVIPEQVSTVADLPTCTNNLDGTIIYVTSKNDYYYCALSEWHSVNAEIEDPPTSSASSSTNDYVCGDMWCASNLSATSVDVDRVITEMDAGGGESGWWWEYDDRSNGGDSYFDWPVAKGNEFSDLSFEPVVRYCGGMCGNVVLDGTSLGYNYAGIGFNVAGSSDGSSSAETANVSTLWDGLCLVYSTDGPAVIELGLTDARQEYFGADVPRYTLPKGNNKVVNISWSQFEQSGWLDEYGDPYPSISGVAAARELKDIKIKFTGADGVYSFNIMSIGTYGSCK